MNWFIHIGVQKTGSKAIQSFFSNNTELLTKFAITYPNNGRSGVWHYPIVQEIKSGSNILLKKAYEEAQLKHSQTAIISSESFYTLSCDQIGLLHKVIKKATIIIYIRRQDELINSLFNQYIKAHNVTYDFIENFEKNIHQYNPKFDYLQIIDRWKKYFGIENITPIIYEKPHCSVNSFLKTIDSIDEQLLNSISTENPNKALNFDAIQILRHVKKINKNSTLTSKLVHAAHKVLKNYFIDTYKDQNCYLLSESIMKQISENYKYSNAMIKKVFFPFKKNLFECYQSKNIKKNAQNEIDQELINEIFRFSGIDKDNSTLSQK